MPDSPGFEATQGITLSYTSMQFHGLQYKLSSRDRNCIDHKFIARLDLSAMAAIGLLSPRPSGTRAQTWTYTLGHSVSLPSTSTALLMFAKPFITSSPVYYARALL
ncbi:hypothetical protein FRB95_007037 [Tulasnella sp. JGI-2019a]|nr:hypothetical protein FRB95_007037 [Tulasnella sp. JGI-2019a]